MNIGIEYYAFALFIAALICVIAIIIKVLFSNTKTKQKLLDERESQLLQLYNTIETMMEEFNDQAKAVTDEFKEYESRASRMSVFDLPPELEKKEQIIEKLPRTLPLDAKRIRVAGEVLERAERIIKNDVIMNPMPPPVKLPVKEETGVVFQKFFDEAADAPPPPALSDTSSAQSRSSAIMTLAGEGKTDVEIARELGITRNEVKLVVGLTGNQAVR